MPLTLSVPNFQMIVKTHISHSPLKNARFWRPTRSFILWLSSILKTSSPLVLVSRHSLISQSDFSIWFLSHIFRFVLLHHSVGCIWLRLLSPICSVSQASLWKVKVRKLTLGQFINWTALNISILRTMKEAYFFQSKTDWNLMFYELENDWEEKEEEESLNPEKRMELNWYQWPTEELSALVCQQKLHINISHITHHHTYLINNIEEESFQLQENC